MDPGWIMELDPYLYHAHHAHARDDLAFWLDQAAFFGGPVLELGCGTGRVALPLAEAGFTVCGLDHDLVMLGALRSLSSGLAGKRVLAIQADMTAFRLASRFPLIILPCNTLSALGTPDRTRMLNCVRSHLAPGGRFISSLPNPSVLAELPAVGEPEIEEIIYHPLSGDPVQVASAWSRDADRVSFRWYYDRLHPDGSVERLAVTCHHEVAPVDVHVAELHAAGLELDAMYGDFDRRPYSPETPYLILVAGAQ